jgi:hypothetical protein
MTADQYDASEQAIFTLHRYFIWTNRMRNHFLDAVEAQGPVPNTRPEMTDQERETAEFEARAWLLPPFLYGSYWLASLYVLVEGWKNLKLSDPAVDALLDDRFVSLLRRYRNSIFHFQPKYLDHRVEEFMQEISGERQGHASRVHDALERFFWRWFEQRGEAFPIQRPSEP